MSPMRAFQVLKSPLAFPQGLSVRRCKGDEASRLDRLSLATVCESQVIPFLPLPPDLRRGGPAGTHPHLTAPLGSQLVSLPVILSPAPSVDTSCLTPRFHFLGFLAFLRPHRWLAVLYLSRAWLPVNIRLVDTYRWEVSAPQSFKQGYLGDLSKFWYLSSSFTSTGLVLLASLNPNYNSPHPRQKDP